MNWLRGVTVLALILGVLGIVGERTPATHPGSPSSPSAPGTSADRDVATAVEGNTAFALELYAKLKQREGNLFLSPYSISTALAMTHAGARGNTAAQMAQVLHFNLEGEALHHAFGQLAARLNQQGKERGLQLSVANALWGQEGHGFLKGFLDLTQEHYGAGLREVDFARATEAARRTINAWVEKETKGKIKDLIQPGVLSALTRLVLTNAIYFKGDWVYKFKKGATKHEPFTRMSGDTVEVPMMHQTGDFNYGQFDDLQVLELAYVGSQLSMVVLLPNEPSGIGELEESLTPENLTEWCRRLYQQEVGVALPKFTMTCEFELSDVLKSMGMTDAFSRADFSGMTGRRDLFISAVIHKAYVEVDEKGTKAAAATAIGIGCAASRPPRIFRADHPFLFLIRDNASGSILFMGRVMNPKAA